MHLKKTLRKTFYLIKIIVTQIFDLIYKFKIFRNNRLIKKYGLYDKRTFNINVQEKNLRNLRKIDLNENSIFIDGGSHRGEELSYLKDIGCQIHSFEIHPEHFKNLKRIYGKNKNIILNNVGIGTKDCIQKAFFKKKNCLGSMSLFQNKEIEQPIQLQ